MVLNNKKDWQWYVINNSSKYNLFSQVSSLSILIKVCTAYNHSFDSYSQVLLQEKVIYITATASWLMVLSLL